MTLANETLGTRKAMVLDQGSSVGSGSPCRFCQSTLQHEVVDLGMSPLANSYLASSQRNRMEPFYPLRAFVCSKCLLVQLEDFGEPTEIFSDYAYFSSYSESWLQHARSFVDLAIDRFELDAKSLVLEIASNDGYLLQYFVARQIPVLGIDPAANVAESARQKGIPTQVEFFTSAAARRLLKAGIQGDLIVANNVLAHVPRTNDFVVGLKTSLRAGGTISLEFPHLLRLMEENQFDTIYHEHFSYFSLLAATKVFAAHGLTVFDVEPLTTHGGSLRISVRHSQEVDRPVSSAVEEIQEQERAAGMNRLEYYSQFSGRVHETKRKLLEFFVEARALGKSIVGYGAPAKGNTLLNFCGIDRDFVSYTVDRSPHKQGRFLPGTHIPIFPPERIQETQPDYVLVLPWNLKEEIMGQMSFVRDWEGKFVVPIPSLQVFDSTRIGP